MQGSIMIWQNMYSNYSKPLLWKIVCKFNGEIPVLGDIGSGMLRLRATIGKK